MKKSLANHDRQLRVSDFCLLRCGPAQASALRSEASRALRSGEKIERLPKGSCQPKPTQVRKQNPPPHYLLFPPPTGSRMGATALITNKITDR